MTGDLAVPAPHNIAYRAMAASDVGSVPVGCMGEADELDARIATLGSAAILAFDGDRHVGQLQFRQYIGGQRSPDSIWDPLYWMDFDDRAPSLPPARSAFSATTSASSTTPTTATAATSVRASGPGCSTTSWSGRPPRAWRPWSPRRRRR
ncbi:MAG: hypothetical protein F4091_01330 [Acidimicrobiales bacterium]|nr:hypothetical protein [Acidimicrobiales bacterium]MYD84370.1 hypothetical protein [Acidimicrobiales bacterium]MYJ64097.1 hypothetical protein [Acidimicrobiales bacterium]